MPFDFNGEDIDPMDGYSEDPVADDQPEVDLPVPGAPQGAYSDNTPESILDAAEEQEDYEQVLSQVDRRMRVAQCYRSILNSDLFNDETSEAKIVQNRIRKFCNEELEIIFGMRLNRQAVAVSSQFTAEEADILKNLAAQVRLAKEAKDKPKPVVKAPTVNRVQTNQPATLKIPKPKVSAKPTVQLTAVATVKPSPKTSGVDLRIPEQWRKDPTAKVVKGKVYIQARNDDGEPLWRTVDPKTGAPIAVPVAIMRDVTPMAVPPVGMAQPIPMPSIVGGTASPFSQIMQQAASAQLAGLDRIASIPGVGGAAARLMGGALTQSIGAGEDVSSEFD